MFQLSLTFARACLKHAHQKPKQINSSQVQRIIFSISLLILCAFLLFQNDLKCQHS